MTNNFRIYNSATKSSSRNSADLLLETLLATEISASSLIYTPSSGQQIYTITGYTPAEFASTSTRHAYFMNNSVGTPESVTYDPSVVMTLPANAQIVSVEIIVTEGITPVQEPYKTIMIGTQPIAETTALIDGDIISGDSNLFVTGREYGIDNIPLHNGQYIGGFLTYPSGTTPSMAVTIGVDFIPGEPFVTGNMELRIRYVILE
jgi:hypothetical protein